MTTPAENPAPNRDAQNRFTPVTLGTPVRRGETEIAELQIRKPKAGELRGLVLADILQTDVTALLTLIPRVTEPPLTSAEANDLEPEDLAEIGGAIRGFFMTPAEKAMIETMIDQHRPKT